MSRKAIFLGAIWCVVLILVGLTVRLTCESVSLERKTREIRRDTANCERALEAARKDAREAVRAKLRREEAAAQKTDRAAAVRILKVARKRRAKVRRLFSSHRFTASPSYRQATAMPIEDPSEEDQEIIDLAGEAASEIDLDTAADVLEAALASKDPRARISAVEMLSELGEAGMPDLSEFLEDPHPDVANLAADRWELGIQELTDEGEQAALAKVGFLAMSDADHLRSLGGTLMLVSDARLAVDVLAEVIRDGTAVQRTAARETYENVTGEKWVDEKTASAWLTENGYSETTQTQEQQDESE